MHFGFKFIAIKFTEFTESTSTSNTLLINLDMYRNAWRGSDKSCMMQEICRITIKGLAVPLVSFWSSLIPNLKLTPPPNCIVGQPEKRETPYVPFTVGKHVLRISIFWATVNCEGVSFLYLVLLYAPVLLHVYLASHACHPCLLHFVIHSIVYIFLVMCVLWRNAPIYGSPGQNWTLIPCAFIWNTEAQNFP